MAKSKRYWRESVTLALLFAYFIVLGALFYFGMPGQLSWDILLVSAIIWLGVEARGNSGRLGNALKIGLFLMVFDFIFENSGWVLGLWQTHSSFAIGVVPIEVMGIAFFGGAAWALYLPRKFRLWHSLADCTVFALFGSLGEWMLIRQGLFVYKLWWTSELAFVAYFGTWVILHFVRYRVFRD
ncbi:MAG: hypothetical protein KGH59_01315 [Candidatus Micrarchaeota archaeon]|nr:hypothetical protein [Candidatus Micrarchaeota archaeon]MDE1804405.1 hypothetical protein [Candidatus Micrarchaeota archaeon]MDE1846927.1 hypothetical protein [Candidatus Micrarchaeota archaeon]